MNDGQRNTLRAAINPIATIAQIGDAVRLLAGMVLREQIVTARPVAFGAWSLTPPHQQLYHWLGAEAEGL